MWKKTTITFLAVNIQDLYKDIAAKVCILDTYNQRGLVQIVALVSALIVVTMDVLKQIMSKKIVAPNAAVGMHIGIQFLTKTIQLVKQLMIRSKIHKYGKSLMVAKMIFAILTSTEWNCQNQI